MSSSTHSYHIDAPTVGQFPVPGSLCENCGYSLQGLSLDQDCPECGIAVRHSSPQYRPGLPWQRCVGLRTWLLTSIQMILRPGASYRAMRVGGANLGDRLFLASFVAGLSLAVWFIFQAQDVRQADLWGVIVLTGIPVSVYIEVLGVTFFSRKRGWRVPFELAERVACYAVVGWVPAIVVLSTAQLLFERGYLMDLWNPAWGPYTLLTDIILSSILFGASILWFELLVWIGVRKIRFANEAFVSQA